MAVNTKAIVEKVNTAFAENRPENFLAHCADDVVFTMVGDPTPVKGKEALRKWMASMSGEPPTFTAQHVITEGDSAASHGEMRMKDKEGKAQSYAYCDIYRFRGDKIVELKAFVTKTVPQAQAAGV
jgi:ketosteroid isomerase-like protein